MFRNFEVRRLDLNKYHYKGAQIVIATEVPVYKVEDFRRFRQLRKDVATVGKINRSYGISGTSMVSNKLATMRKTLNHRNYYLYVTMNGRTEYENIRQFDRDLHRYIKDLREKAISNLRYKRHRYSQHKPQHYRPRDIFNTNLEHDQECKYLGSRSKGFVRATAGQIIEMQRYRYTRRMFMPVRPKSDETHVGIEIECGIKISKEQLAELLMPMAGYVMVKGDGSVNVPDRQSVELNICAPVNSYKSVLRFVSDTLNSKQVGAKVNKTCGLHVHLDIRGKTYTEYNDMFTKLVSVQPILYGMQPKSRQSNSYCVRTKTRNVSRGYSRYQGINAQSIWKYQTIEVRLHAGTTEFLKIANWVDLLCGITYGQSITPKRSLSSVRSFFRTFHSVPTTLMEYVMERTRKFTDVNAEETEEAEAI